VRQPQVFLFDEPLSNLDAKLRAQTRIEIQKLHDELHVTSLFVTHDQVEAMTLAQRMIVMNAGRIEQIGTPDEVYARPATTFVASFIGSPPMNLLEGRVEHGQLQGADVRLPVGPMGPGSDRVVLGIRPEHLRVLDSPAEASEGAALWHFDVAVTEMLGAERLVYGRFVDASAAARPDGDLHIVRMDAGLAAPARGQRIQLAVPWSKLHWFDAETRQHIA
jgi:sn-glycerol 3-phosphate transport system ATP-binding protein